LYIILFFRFLRRAPYSKWHVGRKRKNKMPTILDGKKLSAEVLKGLAEKVTKMNRELRLGIVLVGNDPASIAYIEQKKKTGEKIGVTVDIFKYEPTISTTKLRSEVGRLCRLPHMGGVIVQLPLPESINTQSILNAVLPWRDVDVLSAAMSGKLYAGTSPVLPPTAAAIMKLIESGNIEVAGKTVAIVGTGKLVGKPTGFAMGTRGATVLMINSSTKNPADLIRQADIVVAGVGKPNFITADMVKEGAVIIDAGYEQVNGKLVGDVEPAAFEKSSAYTPVPGGVGPMTVAMLFSNLVTLSEKGN
jgi:methylenetetrahydrofolate dehydrogenase (NADP+)/methenyltetrahydrofolate cyclohydrolase